VVHARTDGEEHTVDEPLIHCFDGKQLVLTFVGRTALADYFRMARAYGQTFPRERTEADDPQHPFRKRQDAVVI